MSIELRHAEAGEVFHINVIYAKCKPVLRRGLWETLRFKSIMRNVPWCVIGDLNFIASIKEKTGEIPYQMNKSLDFLSMIEDCGLIDLGYYGSRYTGSNVRGLAQLSGKRWIEV